MGGWNSLPRGCSSVCCELLSPVQLCDPMDYSLPGSSVYRIHQVRIAEWVDIPFSRRSSQARLNPGLLHCRHILYCLGHQGSPLSLWLLRQYFPVLVRCIEVRGCSWLEGAEQRTIAAPSCLTAYLCPHLTLSCSELLKLEWLYKPSGNLVKMPL